MVAAGPRARDAGFSASESSWAALLKLPRLVKFPRLIRHLGRLGISAIDVVRMAMLFFSWFLIAHWVACGFYLIGRLENQAGRRVACGAWGRDRAPPCS